MGCEGRLQEVGDCFQPNAVGALHKDGTPGRLLLYEVGLEWLEATEVAATRGYWLELPAHVEYVGWGNGFGLLAQLLVVAGRGLS